MSSKRVHQVVLGVGFCFNLTKKNKGHNFGAWHDQDFEEVDEWDCDNDSGIMGYGDSQDAFSYCTRQWVNDYFDGDGDWCGSCSSGCCWDLWDRCYCSSGCPDNCACLGTSNGGNNGDDDDDDNDDNDDGSDVDCANSYASDCVQFLKAPSVYGVNFNGQGFMVSGCHNGYAYWETIISNTRYYLYYSSWYKGWHVHTSFEEEDCYLWCGDGNGDTDPMECSSSNGGDVWKYQSGSWSRDGDAYTSTCTYDGSIIGRTITGGDTEGKGSIQDTSSDDDSSGTSCTYSNCVSIMNMATVMNSYDRF